MSERREAALHKFRAKRKERFFGKKIRYHSRKKLADARPRKRGQFISQGAKRGEGSDKDDGDAVSNECSTIETNEKDEVENGEEKVWNGHCNSLPPRPGVLRRERARCTHGFVACVDRFPEEPT
eukprot:scaffold6702_cov390-Prasinococcus_capsulatus_cf.AAC.4